MHHSGAGIDNKGDYACVRAEGMWKIPIPSSYFCCEPKLLFKKNIFKLQGHKHSLQHCSYWQRGGMEINAYSQRHVQINFGSFTPQP